MNPTHIPCDAKKLASLVINVHVVRGLRLHKDFEQSKIRVLLLLNRKYITKGKKVVVLLVGGQLLANSVTILG